MFPCVITTMTLNEALNLFVTSIFAHLISHMLLHATQQSVLDC